MGDGDFSDGRVAALLRVPLAVGAVIEIAAAMGGHVVPLVKIRICHRIRLTGHGFKCLPVRTSLLQKEDHHAPRPLSRHDSMF